VIEEIYLGLRNELDEQVDVAIRAHLPTRRGSEKGKLADMVLAAKIDKLSFVHLYCAELECAIHLSLGYEAILSRMRCR
jgi:hypothetical protein